MDDSDLKTSLTLLKALVEGNHQDDAWIRFDRIYRPRIAEWCKRYSRQHADLEDAVAEAMLKVVQKITQFDLDRPEGKFRNWLRTLVENTLRDRLRYIKVRKDQHPSGKDDFEELLNATPDHRGRTPIDELIETLTRTESEQILEDIRSEVDPKTWEAFTLRHFHKLETSEVAQRLQLSVGAVYSITHRIQTRLKTRLDELNQTDTPPFAP